MRMRESGKRDLLEAAASYSVDLLWGRPVQRGRLIVVALVHVDAGFDQQGAALW